ncbi:MAG: phosphonopyruvate decarboxylase [Clostridiales bacterium]|jgi:phosphonopyruvate decarboxylase|nr:phosphonopyruvate decarboxylase [Clostridiales bacterium]
MNLFNIIDNFGVEFFTGVPDSLLRPFCDSVYTKYGLDPQHHIVTHNEGGAVGLAAGYYISAGRRACVYLQNSGLGNIVNPVVSLTNPAIYDIPILCVVGWRGQARVSDEPQHKFQGVITMELLRTLQIETLVLARDTKEQIVTDFLNATEGRSAAILVEKGSLTGEAVHYTNGYRLSRERAIEIIVAKAGDGVIVSSTGKISRELFEVRERFGQSHEQDFLTVGSMGHDSMIALGIALNKPNKSVWCIQGDGAFLMQMGAITVIGSLVPKNFHYIVLNNSAHESVGGMPTVANKVDFVSLAAACGFQKAVSVNSDSELEDAFKNNCAFIEIKCSLGSRKGLGRPTTTPIDNKYALMNYLEAAE